MSCSPLRPIRFGSSLPPRLPRLVFALLAGAFASGLVAQQPAVDEAMVTELARLLAASDARQFDGALLREALQHPDPGVRRQAALAAGRIGDPAAVDLLVPVLGDSAAAVQAAAAFALGMLHDRRAVEPLLGLIRRVPTNAQGAPQVEAATAIAKIGGEEGARGVREVLAGGAGGTATSPAIAAVLLEGWRLGPLAPVPEMALFAQDPDPGIRRRTLFTLARLRQRASAVALLTGLQDADASVRAAAVRGVTKAFVDSARLDPEAIADRIRLLLQDRDPQLRILALRTLASYHDSAFAARVAPLVTDPDIGVAVQAETTLGALGGSLAAGALRARLTSSVFALRRQALIGLSQADSAAGSTAAAAAAAETDWRWRSVAAEAFAAGGDRGRLEALLGDPDGRVMAQALQGLQRVVPASDTSILLRARALLSHADPAVRSTAADLLGRVPRVEDVDLLVQAYGKAAADPFDDAALSAVRALAEIARASSAGRLRVANRFVAAVPRSPDYLVRRAASDQLTDARDAWGPVGPIATGRTEAEYRDVARRWLAPALQGSPNPQVILETDRGAIVLELLPAEAPLTVAAFLGLVDRRFFDGHTWHRVVPNFVVQDGDPRGDGWGGPGFVLRDEVNPIRYETGTMGMALSGPDTGGSQFFITHSAQPHLDGTYTVFGRVINGGNVLQTIAMGDHIRSIHR